MSGYCKYPSCSSTKQGCFRIDCKFEHSKLSPTAYEFNDIYAAIEDAQKLYREEPMALDALKYISGRLKLIQNYD